MNLRDEARRLAEGEFPINHPVFGDYGARHCESALLAFAKSVLEECARIAEQCALGVAVEIGDGKTFPLGIMYRNHGAAQKATAIAIAETIRAMVAELLRELEEGK